MNNQISNSKFQISNKSQITNNNKKLKPYDLEERTLAFSKEIIRLSLILKKNIVNLKLIDQLLRSATSIGANYREANETETKKDFKNRIRIARKEAKETTYWLKLLLEANPNLKEKISTLLNEACQLLKILASIGEKIK